MAYEILIPLEEENQYLALETRYQLGGTNWGTGNNEKRGIYLNFTKQTHHQRDGYTSVETSLYVLGNYKIFIKELTRKSDKKLKESTKHTDNLLKALKTAETDEEKASIAKLMQEDINKYVKGVQEKPIKEEVDTSVTLPFYGEVEAPKTAKEVMKELANKGIGTRPFFYPMHQQPVFNNKGLFKNEEYPNATKLYERGFYIPSGLAITEEQIKQVSKILHEVLV